MTTSKHHSDSDFAFAARLKELEDITAWFETKDVDLTLALKKFEKGMELASDLKEHLQQVENRVIKIKQRFENSVPEEPPVAADEVEGDDLELELF